MYLFHVSRLTERLYLQCQLSFQNSLRYRNPAKLDTAKEKYYSIHVNKCPKICPYHRQNTMSHKSTSLDVSGVALLM